LKKIAIIGPESTGKSTLCKALSAHYQEPFVPEYGRTYLEENGIKYTYEDLLFISKGMVAIEDEKAKEATNLLFCDTDLIMMKVWYEVRFGKCHPWVLEKIEAKPYDFYLICSPDLPWQEDPMRENPHIREELFERYLKEVNNLHIPFHIVKGEKRLQSAKKVLDIILHK
jgi:NadR type nicotinamide-nucleotide adenylyltransferase